ncbi:MAG: hypothetical protein AB1898_10340 [Acidobacteriota bacterium]
MKGFGTSTYLFLMLVLPPLARSEVRLEVQHDHWIGSCKGTLVFSEEQVEYTTSDLEDARTWSYQDIQQVGLLGPKRLSLVTYEDRKSHLGKDKIFNFDILKGELSTSLLAFLRSRMARPVVSSVLPSDLEDLKYEIPVKHQHALGGCQGVLRIGNEQLIYRTSHESHSRAWTYQDISAIGSTGPFQVRVTALDRVGGEIGAERTFIFSLKERLSTEIYDYLWWKVNPTVRSAYRKPDP